MTLEQEKIFKENKNLIHHVYHKNFYSFPEIEDDLFSEGAIALMDVIKKYKKGSVKFSTYAENSIKQEMIKYVNKHTNKLNGSLGTLEAYGKIRKLIKDKKAKGEKINDKIICEELNMTQARLNSLRELDGGVGVSDINGVDRCKKKPLIELIPNNEMSTEDRIVRNELIGYINDFTSKLDARDRDIFFCDINKGNFYKMAEKYGISYERTQQLKRRVMDKLKKSLKREQLI